jgi:hypothetical protein
MLDFFARWLAIGLLLITAVLSACASGPRVVDHAFGFNIDQDSPTHEILAYRYGAGLMHTTSSETSIRQFGRSRQGTNINGPMPLGDTLYVKWRDKATDQTYEDTVDLRPLLPRDMTNQRIHFVVTGPQLYVYLKDMKRYADPKDPIVGPFKLQVFVTRQIYPVSQ